MSARVGVLASGSGTNFAALVAALHAEPAGPARVVRLLCNVPGAGVLERAAVAGVPAALVPHRGRSRADFEAELVAALRADGVDWVVLAGFMRVLTPVFLGAFPGRVINVHPALLPAFPGVDAQSQAHAAGVWVAGCTVHLVDDGVDTGPILAQGAVPRWPADTRDDLQRRILAVEHALLPRVVRWAAAGRLRVDGRRVSWDLPPGERPVLWWDGDGPPPQG